ncbi:MAG TPA: hypothetical protein VND21_07895, partial [Planctomycetota bacterium]|nr:hypothetical protein [Planctomycetota bacterium]
MSLRRLAFLVAACLSCAPLAGCATRRGGCDPCCGRVSVPTSVRPADPWAAAASVHGRGRRAVWTYLASRYDRDRDGRIRPEEHPGGAVVVKRLDDDGDGLLTAADFDGATRMAHYITALVFERIAVEPVAPDAPAPAGSAGASDGMPSQEVLSHAFEKTDRDRSGTLDATEVVAALDVAMRTPAPDAPDLPAGVRPFPFLLEATDADANGRVALPEVLAWRAERAEREAAALAARAADGKPPAAPPRRPEAPAVGAPAPDFTLT